MEKRFEKAQQDYLAQFKDLVPKKRKLQPRTSPSLGDTYFLTKDCPRSKSNFTSQNPIEVSPSRKQPPEPLPRQGINPLRPFQKPSGFT